MQAMNSITVKRRASGSLVSPATTPAILARYSHITARIDPSWIITVKTSSSYPTSSPASSRCAVEEIGRNSVSPWMTPSSAARRTVKKTCPLDPEAPLRRARAARLVLTALPFRHLSGHRRWPPPLAVAQEDRDRRGDEDRRVGPADDADEHREREPAERFAAEEIQRQHRQERRAGRDDRPRQRLVDAQVHHLLEGLAAHRPQVFPHAIEDHDRVVHRIAGDRQQRGDN